MKLYAKIENEETKACSVGIGTNTEFYKSIGMQEMDVEQAWDGSYYLAGYAPEKPKWALIADLKKLLADADYWGQKYIDGEYTEAEWNEKKAQRKAWREQIRALENENSEDQ